MLICTLLFNSNLEYTIQFSVQPIPCTNALVQIEHFVFEKGYGYITKKSTIRVTLEGVLYIRENTFIQTTKGTYLVSENTCEEKNANQGYTSSLQILEQGYASTTLATDTMGVWMEEGVTTQKLPGFFSRTLFNTGFKLKMVNLTRFEEKCQINFCSSNTNKQITHRASGKQHPRHELCSVWQSSKSYFSTEYNKSSAKSFFSEK